MQLLAYVRVLSHFLLFWLALERRRTEMKVRLRDFSLETASVRATAHLLFFFFASTDVISHTFYGDVPANAFWWHVLRYPRVRASRVLYRCTSAGLGCQDTADREVFCTRRWRACNHLRKIPPLYEWHASREACNSSAVLHMQRFAADVSAVFTRCTFSAQSAKQRPFWFAANTAFA